MLHLFHDTPALAASLRIPPMNDRYSNGQKWENLALGLIDLSRPLGTRMYPRIADWRPMPPTEGTQAAWDTWQETETAYRERVHEAARELIRTSNISDPAPEIVYFLDLRLRAAFNHIETLFAMKGERPVSLLPFPSLPPEEVIEWFLTEWADEHAIELVFPEMANP